MQQTYSFASRFTRVYNLLYFFWVDRDIYDRLIAHGANPVVARNVVALLHRLNGTMGVRVNSYLRNNNDDCAFFRLIAEAESILDCVRGDLAPRNPVQAIPIISSIAIMPMPIDLGYFNKYRDWTAGLVTHTLVFGRFFFDDALFATFRRYEAARKDATRSNAAPPPMPQELERHFKPLFLTNTASVDERSLIINFLRESPLSEQEIAFYFQEKWRNCVERVSLEEMSSSSPAHSCARVVFDREGYVSLAFNGQVELKFAINGKQVSARRVE